MIISDNFRYLLKNTLYSYPIEEDEEKALDFLKLINNKYFLYNNICNYDILDYEKIIYIEIKFKDSIEIQQLIQDIKNNIAEGYLLKNQYKNRIIDFPNHLEDEKTSLSKGFYGIPSKEI